MNISIEIGGPLAEAINNLAAALVSAKQADVVIERAAEKATRKAKKTDPVSEPAPEAAPEPAAEPESENVAAPEPVADAAPTREEAKKAVLSVAKLKGHDAAAALLAKFGAVKISEVKDEDIAAIIAAAKEL